MKVLLIVHDVGALISTFPLNVAYLASVIRNAGHEVTIYHQDVFHYPESHLVKYLKKNKFDAVGLGFIAGYYQYRKILKISEAINSVPNKPYFILGGHGPSPEPEYFLKKTKADAVCVGESEITIVELLKAVREKSDINSVNGIAFMDKGKCVQTPKRELIKDVNTIPLPAWDLFPMDYYVLMWHMHKKPTERVFPMLSGRGCPFTCNFCYRIDEGFRARSVESIVEEIKILKNKYKIDYILFYDELLMNSERRVENICNAFLKEKLNIKWACCGRLNFATPRILNLMRKSGCAFINYGIECVDDKMLKVMNKNLTVKQITNGIKATLKSGISPGFNIIFGNIGEDERTLQQSVDFLLKYDDGAQFRTIRPVTPYPGCPLYYYAIENGMLKDVADFYENKHVNSDLLTVNFTKLSDKKFNEVLHQANKKLITNYYKNKTKAGLEDARKLYVEQNAAFRGFRKI